ncbi:CCA tRNA nucleotidyltransferase, mitochondrial [Tetrabaena socialis]|uniref:CCA tRNA nucleotidyltransferase, mitochondrial n=1 Tax=Tetrabaena socialis TaxID=47790 RepID=A0A2J8AFU4_9CHLO|nr:CCA tRNA nucleotidyltransferase, mitochondrial [Tetrabaena socialis]|eukprot:PNH11388.1 CCA tRNA nucleotidyltransferase, mitochondrial [Tetrabaena socialis]
MAPSGPPTSPRNASSARSSSTLSISRLSAPPCKPWRLQGAAGRPTCGCSLPPGGGTKSATRTVLSGLRGSGRISSCTVREAPYDESCAGEYDSQRAYDSHQPGREARHAAVIQSNPDQSKHLETARMKIGDVWIDLVNLRSETYAADSRIPTMTFGTPEQDALRRDFTVNALFYNISAGGVVEDLTGRGLQDLRDGLIRTPLPPMETFLDDPLRVLRAVRFGTRFSFRLHPDILLAAGSEQVRVALASKISKERIGTELEGMFNGPAPVEAVRLLQSLGLFPAVFALPPPLDARLGTGYGAACCSTMAAADGVVRGLGLQLDKEERRFLLLAALLLPLRALQHSPPKGKPVPATAAIIRDSLKWRVKDIDMTAVLHDTAAELAAAHAVLQGGEAAAAATAAEGGARDVRMILGHAIRKLKQHWKLGVVLATVLRMRAAAPLPADGSGAAPGRGGAAGEGEELGEAAAGARLEMARELVAAVEAYGLGECWSWKPLMDGKKVMALLGWSKPGPELGRVMAAVADWQLLHPAGTAQEAEAMVRERFGKAGAAAP